MIPCLFIDGVDLLAADEDAFLRLVSYAKEFANNRLMHIILVSSEGSVIPLLNETSGINRSASLIEIGDISHTKAVNFLIKGGITKTTSEKLVQRIGG